MYFCTSEVFTLSYIQPNLNPWLCSYINHLFRNYEIRQKFLDFKFAKIVETDPFCIPPNLPLFREWMSIINSRGLFIKLEEMMKREDCLIQMDSHFYSVMISKDRVAVSTLTCRVPECTLNLPCVLHYCKGPLQSRASIWITLLCVGVGLGCCMYIYSYFE